MGHVTIALNGRSYRLRCGDGEEARLAELADHLSLRVERLAMDFGQHGDERLLLMAALHVTDEMLELRIRVSALETALAARDRERDTGRTLVPDAGSPIEGPERAPQPAAALASGAPPAKPAATPAKPALPAASAPPARPPTIPATPAATPAKPAVPAATPVKPAAPVATPGAQPSAAVGTPPPVRNTLEARIADAKGPRPAALPPKPAGT